MFQVMKNSDPYARAVNTNGATSSPNARNSGMARNAAAVRTLVIPIGHMAVPRVS